eukprot:11179378-Lingulodinium_polyedra.AAC.1
MQKRVPANGRFPQGTVANTPAPASAAQLLLETRQPRRTRTNCHSLRGPDYRKHAPTSTNCAYRSPPLA